MFYFNRCAMWYLTGTRSIMIFRNWRFYCIAQGIRRKTNLCNIHSNAQAGMYAS